MSARLFLLVCSCLGCTLEPPSPSGSNETNLLSRRSIPTDCRSMTNMLVVTTTMRMLYRVHSHTTNLQASCTPYQPSSTPNRHLVERLLTAVAFLSNAAKCNSHLALIQNGQIVGSKAHPKWLTAITMGLQEGMQARSYKGGTLLPEGADIPWAMNFS